MPLLKLHTLSSQKRDPSMTTGLRRIFALEMTKRFNALVKLIKKAIVTEDLFALQANISTNELEVLQDMYTPGRRAFDFSTDSRKIAAFMDWIREQIERGILDVRDINQVGESVNSAWQNKYIFDSYGRGVQRARAQMKEKGFSVPSLAESGGLAAVLSAPMHLDRVGLIYIRAFNELKGVTDSMSQLISRVLASGMAEGLGPKVVSNMLVHAITGAGETLELPISYVKPDGTLVNYVMPARQRAQILARTEIIRAHAQGQLQEFKNWRVAGVSSMAEFLTAGDDRVCQQCSGMESNIYTIEEASNIIPVHPQCRCIWIPVDVTDIKRK